MLLQQRFFPEANGANVALERLHADVDLNVPSEIGLEYERFTTKVASKRRFPTVHGRVHLQVAHPAEGGGAAVALMFLLLRMHPHVPPQVRLLREGGRALMADERPPARGVNAHVLR